MVNTHDDKTPPHGPDAAGDFTNTVKASAQQVWQAGLGAFAKAQAEGSKLFDALAKEGATMQQKARTASNGRFDDLGQRFSGLAEELQSKAGQQWGRLETLVEERLARSLAKSGVPTREEFDALRTRVETARPAARRGGPAAGHRRALRAAARRTAPQGRLRP